MRANNTPCPRRSNLSVACPYGMTMFEDGLRDENATGTVQVRDVAESFREVGRILSENQLGKD